MKWKIWCALLVSVLLLLSAATAEQESIYQLLTQEHGVTSTDLCAWLEIPGAGLTLPIMQHPEDPTFYLKHNALGAEDKAGALYTEKDYNSRDFSDTVTVIYGMRRNDGTMFGSLQEWYSGAFAQHEQILVHLPGETRTYTAVAAVPYANIHLLYYNDFSYTQVYNSFVEDIYSVRRIGVQLDQAGKPQAGERLIILSTTMRGDANQRFLVVAKEVR